MQVTDAHDRHTLMTVLQTYYNPTILEAGHALSPSGVYQSLDLPNHKAFLDYIASLPIIASPDVFGLHDNADISKDLKETNLLLDSLLLTQSRDAAGWSDHPHLHTFAAVMGVHNLTSMLMMLDISPLLLHFQQSIAFAELAMLTLLCHDTVASMLILASPVHTPATLISDIKQSATCSSANDSLM